jgi:hypothetical protein
MGKREDAATARRAAREARRAALRAGADENGARQTEPEDDGRATVDPVRAAREAATAAAVGAAVGAVRALTSRRQDDNEEEPLQDVEAEEEAPPEAEAEPEPEPRRTPEQPRRAADAGQVERALRAAREQLRLLNGVQAETVSSFARTRDGWRVTLEVVEVRRIPETTDVLASYAVELDDDGGLVAYERLRRYQRSEALEGS